MRRSIVEAKFEELRDKRFVLIRVVELLCEVCRKPLSTREKTLREICISSYEEYQNLLSRSIVHDRAEVDLENRKIYFFDHDFPGDIHQECLEKL